MAILESEMMQNSDSSSAAEDRPKTLKQARQEFERQYIVAELERQGWHISKTASRLGILRPNLYRRMRDLKISLRKPLE